MLFFNPRRKIFLHHLQPLREFSAVIILLVVSLRQIENLQLTVRPRLKLSFLNLAGENWGDVTLTKQESRCIIKGSLSGVPFSAKSPLMDDIDVVITWVDGAAFDHHEKRARFMSAAEQPLHRNAINPHRWIDSDELGYCLRSIELNAPWIRRVWIITDDQQPRLTKLSSAFRAKISIIDHREIFAGYEHVLPTFNSISIETMLWRISGLAEKFLYFNDDVFVTTPVKPDDFFTPNGPVLRGHWADHGDLERCAIKRSEVSLLNHFNQIKSAALIGYGADHIFLSAHVVHPMLRSVMEKLFAEHREIFLENMAHRFRCTEQFLPQALHNHACIRDGSAAILDTLDHFHLPVGMFDDRTVDQVRADIGAAASPAIKFLCINDLPTLEQHIGDARNWIEYVIGLRTIKPKPAYQQTVTKADAGAKHFVSASVERRRPVPSRV